MLKKANCPPKLFWAKRWQLNILLKCDVVIFDVKKSVYDIHLLKKSILVRIASR